MRWEEYRHEKEKEEIKTEDSKRLRGKWSTKVPAESRQESIEDTLHSETEVTEEETDETVSWGERFKVIISDAL